MTVLAKGENHVKGKIKSKSSQMNAKVPKARLSRRHCNEKSPSNVGGSPSTNVTGEKSLKSTYLGSSQKGSIRNSPLKINYGPIPCIVETNSYGDVSAPIPLSRASSDDIDTTPKGVESDDDGDEEEILGGLSKVVAQDLFEHSILPPTSRRRSMIDFASAGLDGNVCQMNDLGVDYNTDGNDDNDSYNNSSILDRFPLRLTSQQERRRKSCPSLSFTWVETKAVRGALGEEDVVQLGPRATAILDCADADKFSFEYVEEINENVVSRDVSLTNDNNDCERA